MLVSDAMIPARTPARTPESTPTTRTTCAHSASVNFPTR
jgi:hypothetical protein